MLRTLLHGAFPWLQPRSPVEAERGRGPDPPDARVEALASGPPESARAVRASPAGESHRVVALGNLPPDGKVVDARLRGSQAVAKAEVGNVLVAERWLA